MEPKIVPVSTGEVLEFSEWAAVIKVAAETTNGTLTVIETRHDPGEGASTHIHSRESETFLVMDGRVVHAGAGGYGSWASAKEVSALLADV